MKIKRQITPPNISTTLKKPKIPDGFILVQDTREQLPLFARLPKGLIIKSDTLKVGDYSIEGFQDIITIERKNISDLLTFIGGERKKTIEKLKVMSQMEYLI